MRRNVLIFGFRTKVLVLMMVTLLCPRCGNPAAHPLHKAVTKFTLFFIPLFPVKTRYTTQCTFCGVTSGLPKDQATRLLQQGGGQPGSFPGHGAQPHHPYPPRT